MTPASTEAAEQERLREWERLAHEAWQRGQDALAADDLTEAVRWLDRASRLARTDQTVRLSLALAYQKAGDPRALELFEELALRHEAAGLSAGLARLRLAAGDPEGAANALGRALGAAVMTAELPILAEAVARASAAAGWCGLEGGGSLRFGLNDPLAEISVALDGRPVRLPVSARASSPIRLPARWRHARLLEARVATGALIGSPIRLDAIRRIEGFVEDGTTGLTGWAWHPGDPDRDPVLNLVGADGRLLRFIADGTENRAQAGTILARPRGFQLSPRETADLTPPFRVVGEDGRDLRGSPVLPLTEQAPWRGGRPLRRTRDQDAARDRVADVVIPVHGGGETTLACLRSVIEATPKPTRIIVVDDASPDLALRHALADLAHADRIHLISDTVNRGFPASANAGIRAAGRRDVVLLNSDTLVPPFWLDRLRDAVAGASDIGTASPLSNDATILSYPAADAVNAVPDQDETRRLAELAYQANGTEVVDVPTTVGFCMYIRRECLDTVDLLREDAFAQGYGEENDFCMRARARGWRHVAVTGAFVAHVGGQSFGAARAALMARNQAILDRLHPDYPRLVAEFLAEDPLAAARRRLDLARWRQRRRPGQTGAVVLVTHDSGGGVERSVAAECAAHRAAGLRPIVLRPIVLRPTVLRGATPAGVVVGDGVEGGFSNLRFRLPGEIAALVSLLAEEGPARVVIHHTLGHDPSVLELAARLGVPHDVQVHDYVWFCPRISLLGAWRRYCGEPDVAGCDACVAVAGSLTEEAISVASLVERSAAVLGTARRIVVPSADSGQRLRRHFPGVEPVVIPPQETPPAPRATVPDRRGRRRICVIGGIGAEKGYDILLGCARDAALRALPLEFVVVGHTADDAALLATGRAFITGFYEAAEAVALIRAQQADLAFLPSIIPETWCYTLTEAWAAGLDVVAFDIGAPAERIRRTADGRGGGRGRVLPLGLPVSRVNDALLAAWHQIGHECAAGAVPA